MFTDGDPALDTTDAKEMLMALVTGQEKMLERILRRAQTEGRADDTRKATAPPPNPLLWSLARTLLWTCR